MTNRKRVHAAFRRASTAGACNLPACAFPSWPHDFCTTPCNELAVELETARKDALTEAYLAITNLCDPCSQCGTTGDCERCQALGLAEQCLARLRDEGPTIGDEIEDGSDEADELDYQDDDAR